MSRLWILFFLILGILQFTSCHRHIKPDRSQFLKDGERVPTVDLSYYKSVQQRLDQDSTLAVAMAISGGGNRAANFGIGVMLGLEEILLGNGQNALNQVDYLSTVSGGGFAGGAYINALYTHYKNERKQAFQLKDYLKSDIEPALTYSYFGTLVRANFNVPLVFSKLDDGDILERAIDNWVLGFKKRKKEELVYNETKSILLGDIFIPKGSTAIVKYPMFITNSTILSTVTIFPFAPDILEQYQINGYTHRMKRVYRGRLDPYTVPLAVGIKASGSFPVLISNTTLRTYYHEKRSFLHLIDGAMTDNNGYFTALELLKQEQTPVKVMFIVDADADGNRYTFAKRERAYLGLDVYNRLASSGLDARKGLLSRTVEADSERFGFRPIYFSFNILIRDNYEFFEFPEKLPLKAETQRLIELMLKDLNALEARDLQILYEILTQIGTKYSMTEEEQLLLFLAGKKIVLMQKTEILNVLK